MSRLLAFLAGLLFAAGAHAQIIAVVVGGGSGGGGGGDPEEIYDLYSTDENERGVIPFPANWPTAPGEEPGSECALTPLNVTNNTNLATALATACAVIAVAAGSYNPLDITEDDQHWILHDDADFSDFQIDSRVSRIKIEGGNLTTGAQSLIVDDLLVDNVNVDGAGFVFGTSLGADPVHRVALVHNTINATQFPLITGGNIADGPGEKSTDLIVVGNYMNAINGGDSLATLRIQGVTRFIFVDNRTRNGAIDFEGGASHRALRTHYGTGDVWVRRILEEYGDGIYFEPRADGMTVQALDRMGDHYVYDYVIYNPDGNPNGGLVHGYRAGSDANWPGVLVVVDNIAYDYRGPSAEGTRWQWSAVAGDTEDGQLELAYEAPPSMGSWLTARGIQPGADH